MRLLAHVALISLLGLSPLVAARAHAASPPASAPAAPAAKSAAALKEQLDAILASPALKSATVAVHVLDLATGQEVYAANADQPLNPASNAKLFTTAAAFALLGPETRFGTQAWAAKVEGGEVIGDLYLVGDGDPALTTGQLYELAEQLRANGIRKIQGGITVDNTRYATEGLPPGFDQKQELASYRAPTGATSVNFNTYEVFVVAGPSAGKPTIVAISPPSGYVKLINRSETVAGSRNKLVLSPVVNATGIELTIEGTLGVDARTQAHRYPVAAPSLYAGSVMRMVLEQVGIKVGRESVKIAPRPSTGRLLGTHRSDTLSVLARSINKLSNNFMAEQVLLALAPRGGTAQDALQKVRTWVGSVGVPVDGLSLGNGSGLYDNNRTSARMVTSLLKGVYDDFRLRSDFLASLAIMGVDGTTRERLANTPAAGWIRAKTGTLDGVTALSGYAGAPGREPLVFSVLMNDVPKAQTASARAAQNRIAEALQSYIAAG